MVSFVSDFLAYFFGLLIDMVGSTGYAGIFVLMAMESAVLPIPSEVVMPFAGFLVYKGILDLTLVTIISSLANLFGSLVAYFIGKSVGRAAILKYGKYVLLKEHHLQFSEKWFGKYGDKMIFFSRLMPVVRTVISLPAGIAKMDLKKFVIYTFVGSVPWNFALTYLGFTLGKNWDSVHSFYRQYEILIFAALAVFVIYFILHHRKHKKMEKI